MKHYVLSLLTLVSFGAAGQVSVQIQPIDVEVADRIPGASQPFRSIGQKAGSASAAFSPSVRLSFPVAGNWEVSAGLGHSRRYTSTGFNADIRQVKQVTGSGAPVPEKGIMTDLTTRDYYLSVPLGVYYKPRLSNRTKAIIGLQLRGDIRTVGRQTADFLPESGASVPLEVPGLKRDVEAYFAERATPVLVSLSPTLGFDAPLTRRISLVMTGRASWFANSPDRVVGGFGWGLGGTIGIRIQPGRL